ncbi:MAG: phosphoribosylformylglycinamidine synthase subunit PurL [Acidobacteriota bacterium]
MITPELISQHGLTDAEYQRIETILGRRPNLTELGIFSVMWSEHCSYKSSRIHLKKLPTSGACVIQGPGENAGVVDIGDGLAAIFKIESHNHPSFIEPYQGAATGVGGIIRDIFTMGARPVALLNSLRFGPLDSHRNQLIVEGVVAGIAGYGNCIGIPTVGGEIYFSPSYASNPLVNVFCLGICPADRIFYGRAAGGGNPVIYVGAKTGRDGIHGATMASAEFDDESSRKRPTVQVGDPFLEKLLLEACLEAMKTGAIVGIQDMGAAGLTCSTCEMGSRGGTGIEIELELVPQREEKMTPYEILLSESQERMLLVAEKDRAGEVLEIFHKWDLDAVVIGQVTGDGLLRVRNGGQVVAEIPNRPLAEEAPLYDRPAKHPAYLAKDTRLSLEEIPQPRDCTACLLDLIESPTLASKRWIYRQYDHMVRTNTIVLPGSDAAVLRLKESPRALAISVDGNSRYCYLDPRQGARIAVAESCRNLVCSGARPLAATNCLNFASPENPEVMWQFIEVIEGIREACEVFGTPITGGNVSFYNETNGVGIYPTPVIGMLGVLEHAGLVLTSGFPAEDLTVILLGETRAELGASEYLSVIHAMERGTPPILDFDREKRLHRFLAEANARRWLRTAHDCSEGGLALCLVECCLTGSQPVGAALDLDGELRDDVLLFSESQSRAVVSVTPADAQAVCAHAKASGLPAAVIGTTGGKDLRLKVRGRTIVESSLEELGRRWAGSIERKVVGQEVRS